MLGMHILTWLVAILVIGLLVAVCTVVVVGGAFALQAAPPAAQIGGGVLAFLVLGAIATIVSTVFFSWMGLVPIVVCMEDNHRGTSSLGRAYEILRGHWLRITILMAIVGLAMVALFVIFLGAIWMFAGFEQIRDFALGQTEGTAAMWLAIAAFGISSLILSIVGTPLGYLILSVFYLDVRVRQEALDLEWTAHNTAPDAPVLTVENTFIQTPPATQSEYSLPSAQPPSPDHYGTRVLNDDAQTNAQPDAFGAPESTPFADAPTIPRQDG